MLNTSEANYESKKCVPLSSPHRTPRYRFTNLSTSVRVKVQLERPTDKDTSEPLDFTYLPDSECYCDVVMDV